MSRPTSHFEAMNAAIDAVEAYGLKPIEAHVLLVLAYRANYTQYDGWAFPSMKSLCANLGVKPKSSTVYAALKRLRELGILEHRPASPGRVAHYRLAFDVSATPDMSDNPGEGNMSATTDPSNANVSGLADIGVRQDGQHVSGHADPEVPKEEPNEKGDCLGLSEGRQAKAPQQHPYLGMAGMAVDWIVRSTDTLDGDQEWKRPTVETVIPLLVDLQPTWDEVELAAKETGKEIEMKGWTTNPVELLRPKLTRIVTMREWKVAA